MHKLIICILGTSALCITELGASETQADSSSPIICQPSSEAPIGERNPRAPAEVAQFEFLIGHWDVALTWYPENQEPRKLNGSWHNHWINHGFDVMQEWRGPSAVGSEIRHFSVELGYWVGMNLYADHKWIHTTARMKGEEMVVIVEASNPQNGDFLNRETYFDITQNQWSMKSERSFDNGKTWVKGRYDMIATRSASFGD